ncbi:MAG: DUF1566 domain-containing protein [Saccharospirillaceae bacterium]|nr:DUF1566 domain-containing protein [Pseudomonadales bacterium]NRB81065.1 DUF1566 domain-containing protein [Saccharospirillaceae bacterium]
MSIFKKVKSCTTIILPFMFVTQLHAEIISADESITNQVCNNNITSFTGNDRYQIENGIVSDIQSNLQWAQCSQGQSVNGLLCEGVALTYNWKQALESAEASEYNNIQDWRLPNIKELKSLVNPACVNPAINETVFPLTQPEYYWSSTPSVNDALRSYIVDFNQGNVKVLAKGDDLNDPQYVRLVRDNTPPNIPPVAIISLGLYDESVLGDLRFDGVARDSYDEDGFLVSNTVELGDTDIPISNLRISNNGLPGFYFDFNYEVPLSGDYFFEVVYTLYDNQDGYHVVTEKVEITIENNVTLIGLDELKTVSWTEDGVTDLYAFTLNSKTPMQFTLTSDDASAVTLSLHSNTLLNIDSVNSQTGTAVIDQYLEAGTYILKAKSDKPAVTGEEYQSIDYTIKTQRQI